MSICAPSEYWDQLRIHTEMNRDSIADIMDMDEETKLEKIKLAKKVLKNKDNE